MKKIHYLSGITISIFIALHLINHCASVFGAETHIEIMKTFRLFYRNAFFETILFLSVATQIYSGIKLFNTYRRNAQTFFDKLQVWTGLYLAIFFLIHLGAVVIGRSILKLDTNFYFGVAGLNSFPSNLFFIPYYGIAILSFFGHIASIHSKKMKRNIFVFSPNYQAKIILFLGFCLTLILFYGLTNHFKGVTIPTAYNILIGK